jgi:hypothetical protein
VVTIGPFILTCNSVFRIFHQPKSQFLSIQWLALLLAAPAVGNIANIVISG